MKKVFVSTIPALATTFLVFGSVNVTAQDSDSIAIEEIVVSGHQVNLVGEASSASEGIVTQAEIAIRPLLRTGEVLETVPGLVATQHSGPGKANQYFLRGFNLDHGTDFATVVESMPVNMRTHGHGQGYTDLNFLIPELIGEIEYQKGSYYPGVGDFSGTGTARMSSTKRLDQHKIKMGTDGGDENWGRVVATGEFATGDNSSFLYGVEGEVSDGPWDDIDSDLKKKNIWLKQQWQNNVDSYAVLFMGYDNSWNSADQIPQRAVDQGIITEYGSIDQTSGGDSSRYSLSFNWDRDETDYDVKASVYAIDYDMNLWGDFTYYLDNPVGGDQHHQIDQRKIYGWDAAIEIPSEWAGIPVTNTLGSQMRYDDISEVGVFSSVAREETSVFRTDKVEEWSTGLYWKNELQWTDKFRTVFGLRYDYYDFQVDPLTAGYSPSLALNGGNVNDSIVTPSLNLTYAFTPELETYLSAGKGFHSNDARGTTIAVDPVNGTPADKVDPLVDTLGYEFGLRTFFDGSLNASVALWSLDIDSELIFVGDTGTTEDTGVGSKRQGIEITGYYYLNDVWSFDMEYSYADAQFDDAVDGSRDIPGSLDNVISAGVNAKFTDDFYANLRWRYFGDYPLDGGNTADAGSIMNLRLAYTINDHFDVSLDVLNLLDSNDRDIQYFYESRLPGEPAAGVEDYHFHIFEPRAFHLNVTYTF